MDSMLWFLFYLMFAILMAYRVQWVREARILIIEKLYVAMRRDQRYLVKPKYLMDDFEKNTSDFHTMVLKFWEFDPGKFCKKEFWEHIKNAEIKK